MTNTLPVHRLDLPAGAQVAAPAAYVRALDLTVERLEQTYSRIADHGAHHRTTAQPQPSASRVASSMTRTDW
jgi:hypothetical protein